MSPGRRPPPFREAAPGLCPPHSTAVLPHAQMKLPGLQSVLVPLVLALGTTKQNLAPSPCPSSADQHCSDSPSLLSSRCTALGVSACPHHEVLQAPSSSALSPGLSQQFPICLELGSPALTSYPAGLSLCSVSQVLLAFLATGHPAQPIAQPGPPDPSLQRSFPADQPHHVRFLAFDMVLLP